MLMKRHDRNTGDVIESTPTVENAIGELLGVFASHPTALLSVSHDYVQLNAKENWSGATEQYFAQLVFEEQPGEYEAFTRLARMARFLQLLTNWSDGYAEELQEKVLTGPSGYCVTLPDDRESLTRVNAARLGAQWLLGRDIKWQGQDSPDFPSALALAVELELVDPTQQVEVTIAAMLDA